MILREIEVAGCGRFRERTRLAGLGPGVNVLAAPNEAGKSTLFRALRECLFSKHNSTTQDIRALETRDASLPVEVRVAFAHGGHEYDLAKRFLRSPTARLLCDGREFARGREADQAVWEILGLDPAGGRRADIGAFGLLWVEQRGSFEFAPPSDGAFDLINRIVADEIGGLVGGERARAILAAVTAEIALQETETGRPKAGGALRAAMDEAARLRAEEDRLGHALAALDESFTALARDRKALAELSDPGWRAEVAAERDAARTALAEAKAAADVLARRELERRAACQAQEAAAERLRACEESERRIAEGRKRLAEFSAAVDRADAEDAGRREAAATAARTLEAAETAATALAREIEARRRVEDALAASGRARDLAERLDQARDLARRIAEAAAEADAIAITDALLKRIEAEVDEVARLEARVEAGAPRLAIKLDEGGAGRLALDGIPVHEDGGHLVRGIATIRVPGVATLILTPAASGSGDVAALAEARRGLAVTLAGAGVASLAEARAARDRRATLNRDREALAREMTRLAPDARVGTEIAALEAACAAAARTVDVALRESGRETLPGDGEIAAERARLQAAHAEAEAARVRAAALQRAAQERAKEAEIALATARQRLASADEQLARDLGGRSDEERAALFATLRSERESADATLRSATAAEDAARAATPTADEIRQRELRVARLEQSLANNDARREELRTAIAGHEAAIEARGGDGLGEELARVCAAREVAERREATLRRELASLRVLREAIAEALEEGRERYLAPVKNYLRPFLNDLFPGADLDFGERFRPATLARAAAEPVDLLSDGTHEQIAVLVRLALGALLADKGLPAPIVLDDALVFADDERIERMFDALQRASERQQVIVLTCRTRTFARLGGNPLRLDPVREP